MESQSQNPLDHGWFLRLRIHFCWFFNTFLTLRIHIFPPFSPSFRDQGTRKWKVNCGGTGNSVNNWLLLTSWKVNGGGPRNFTTPHGGPSLTRQATEQATAKRYKTKHKRGGPKGVPLRGLHKWTFYKGRGLRNRDKFGAPKNTESEQPIKTKHNQRIHEGKHRKTKQRKTIRKKQRKNGSGGGWSLRVPPGASLEINWLWVNSEKVVGGTPKNEMILWLSLSLWMVTGGEEGIQFQ